MLILAWLLLAADFVSAQDDRNQCRVGRDGFIDLPGLKHAEIEGNKDSGKILYVDMDDTFSVDTVDSIKKCEEKCCENINGHDSECYGYVYYEGENHPGKWRCQIIYIKFWEHGHRLTPLAKAEGGTSIKTMRYREGACRSRELSDATFEDITEKNTYGDQGLYTYQAWRKDVKSAKDCQQLCCDLDIFECHGTVFYGDDAPSFGNCKLLPLEFQFGKYKPSTKTPITSLLEDKTCTGSYKRALDYEHPETGKDVYYDLNEYVSIDVIRSETDCRKRCCDEKYCTGYAYYMGDTYPKSGRCRIYFALFWEGQHHVSAHGKIKSEKKMPGVKCEAENKEAWEEVKNTHGENGWYDVEEWFFTGSEDGCKQNCCDFDGFRCGGYNYYPEGRFSSKTKANLPNCKLMLQGFEYTAKILPSIKDTVHTGIYNHYDQCHDEYEAAEIHEDDKNYFWVLSKWGEEEDVDMKGCEALCDASADCTGYRYYGGDSRPKYGRCRMSFVKEFWTGRLLFTGYEEMEVMMKTDKGFVAVPGRPKKGYYSTYEWLRVESEEGCRNLCCSFPGFECTAYSYYPDSKRENGDDCKLILNANDNMVKESTADEIMHARIKDHLSDQCGAFKRERQMFETITYMRTDQWFKDVESADACAQKMCDESAMTYTFYPDPPQFGNCKIFFGDMTMGWHRQSTKKNIVHGMLKGGDPQRCKTKKITKHNSGDSARGFYSVYAWRTVNNEKECQEHCCDNDARFEGGCGSYSYYRPDDRKQNCKLIPKSFGATGKRVKSAAGQNWIIHGSLEGEDKMPSGGDGETCGFYLKKIKISGSKKSKQTADDSCGCKDVCSGSLAWEYNVKKKTCQCHERKNLGAVSISKVNAAKKPTKAKVFASVNKNGEL